MFYYTTHYYQDLCNSAAVIVADKIWHRLLHVKQQVQYKQ